MPSSSIVTSVGRRNSRAGFIITGGVVGIVAALVAACENPEPPVSCGSIPQQTITVGEVATVSACFDDPNGDVLVYAAQSSDPGVATATGSGGTVTVTAVSPGNATVTIRADDPEGLTGEQSFVVLVPNRPPVVVGEVADSELPVGQSLTLDVSEYFSEPDGQTLAYAADLGADVVEGTLTGPSLTIAGLAKGTAPVTVTATDPGGLAATLDFSVTVPNRGPVAQGTMEARTIEVGEAEMVDVSPFFSDPDGDELVYAVETSDAALAVAEVSGNLVEVTAVAKGSVTVTVTATDTEGASATQSFELTVPNQIPLAVGEIPAQTVEVGQEVSLEMSPFFTDPDGDGLVYEVVTDNAAVAEALAGELAVTVAALAKGSTTMTVTATDIEGASATQTFAVTVPNRAPVVEEALPARMIDVGEAATVDLSSFFSDSDGDDLAYAVVTSDAALAVAEVSGSVITVTAVAKGSVSVTVTATDPEGGATEQSFDVTVPNRAPVAEGTVEAQRIEVGQAATVDMLPFFRDPDGDELAYTVVASDAALATAEVSGSVVSVTALARGSVTVTVTATDTEGAAATQDFAVMVPNRVPVAVGTIPAQTVEVGHEVSLEMGPFFTDPDGDALVYAVAPDNAVVAEGTAGELAVTVAALAKGNATMTVTATDIEGASATQSFSVMVPNRPPAVAGEIPAQTVEVGEERSLELGSYFTDPDGDPLSYEVEAIDATVVEAAADEGVVVLTAMTRGETTVTITAADNEGLTATQTFSVTVPNRAPVAEGTVEARMIEVGEEETVDMTPYFSDPDGDELTYAAVTSDGALATAEVSASLVTVIAVARGSVTVTVTATDTEGASATQNFDVTVPNQPPVAVGTIPAQTVEVGGEVALEMGPFFSDPDGDALAYEVTTDNPAVAEVSVGELGVAVTALAKGNATMTVTATDIDGLTATQTLSVMVPNRPPAPARTIPVQTVEVGEEKTLDAASYFTDPDGDPLSYEVEAIDATVVEAAADEGVVLLTAMTRGETTVTITAADNEGLTATQAFSVTVPNRAPVAGDPLMAQTIEVGETAAVDVSPHFSDPDGDELNYTFTISDAAVANMEPSRHLAVLSAMAKGEAMVTVTATDTEGLAATLAFAVEVPNRRPVAMEAIGAQTAYRDSVVAVEIASAFMDPDGDALVYSVASFNPTVVEATATGAVVTVLTISQGEATVTVQATDMEGLADSASFQVTVPNRAPFVPGRYSRYRLEPGDTLELGVAQYFADPDADPLIVEAESSDERRVTVAVENEVLVLAAVRRGAATVTVTAMDPWGLEVKQEFRVSVVRPGGGGNEDNQPPAVTGTISPRTLTDGEQFTMGVDGYFRDPNGDALTFVASSADEDIAVAAVTGSSLTVTGAGAGTVDVTVTATDPGNLSAAMTFSVAVEEYTGGNRSPAVTRTIESQAIQPDGTFATDLGSHFRDPDDNQLTFSAESSNEGVAIVEVADEARLSLTAVSEGTAVISVKATDTGNLTKTIDFGTTVRSSGTNSAPEIKGTPLADTLRYESRYHPFNFPTFDGFDYFEDPDGDTLTFTATSSNSQAARARQNRSGGNIIWVQDFRFGETTITIKAEDPFGASISQSYLYVVANTAPYLTEMGRQFTEWKAKTGNTDHIPIGRFFFDADIHRGDGIVRRFEVSSSDNSKVAIGATYTGSGGWIHVPITGIADGQATVTVKAFDRAGNSTSMSFLVPVDDNARPEIKKRFPNTLPTLRWGDTLSYTLSEYFEDPDGDTLIYSDSLQIDNELFVVEIAGGVVQFIAPDTFAVNINRVFITATDAGGKSVSQRVQVVLAVFPPQPDSVNSEQQPQLVLSDQALQRAGSGRHWSPRLGHPRRFRGFQRQARFALGPPP